MEMITSASCSASADDASKETQKQQQQQQQVTRDVRLCRDALRARLAGSSTTLSGHSSVPEEPARDHDDHDDEEEEKDDEDDAFALRGLEQTVQEIVALFARTIEFGENQSALLFGTCQSGTSAVVRASVARLSHRFGKFPCVVLNGTLLANEIEAFKEIVACLTHDDKAIDAGVDTNRVVSYVQMYDFLKQLLQAKARANQTVFIVLEELEQFASEKKTKQLLLYNLFDWMQSADLRLGVLGITENYNVLDHFEKRVRSRFSNRQIFMAKPTFANLQSLLVDALTPQTIAWQRLGVRTPPSASFLEQFQHHVTQLLQDPNSKTRQLLQFDYDLGKPRGYFLQLALVVISLLNERQPFPNDALFAQAREVLVPQVVRNMLANIDEQALGLLIAMAHLEIHKGHSFYTFEMVYDTWQAFCRKFGLENHFLPCRNDALKSLDDLLRLQLVQDAGDAFRIGKMSFASSKLPSARATKDLSANSGLIPPEFRVVFLNFRARLLEEMIRSRQLSCSTAMEEWALNGV